MTGPRYVRSPGGVSVEISGEHVMLGPDMNEYFGFRDVAAYIWEQLEQPRTVNELCDSIVGAYAVDEATCRRDTEAFLAELVEQRLAEVMG
ncbi:MAG: PqqD family protein [Nocardioides sp.]|nr:PqqD family protein [Nocardioides sp.]